MHETFKRYLDLSNQAPVYHMWQLLEPNIESVRRRLAAEFGCSPDELAITRNASEALQIAQLGIELEAGDEVVTTNQDYGRMLDTWDQRARRDGIVLKKVSFPVPPASLDVLADRLLAAITPATKVLHFCHITNLTGQIFPVRRICDEARRGVSRRLSTAPTPSPSSRSSWRISVATITAPACTSGCWRRSARAFSTSAVSASRRCGR